MYENYGWKYILTAAITVLWGMALFWGDEPVPLGLDLKGGAEIIYRLEVNGKPAESSVTEDAVNHVMSVFFEAVADLGSEDRTRLAPEDEGADFFSRVGEVVQVICDEEALGRT